jgi:hypothetical protein
LWAKKSRALVKHAQRNPESSRYAEGYLDAVSLITLEL